MLIFVPRTEEKRVSSIPEQETHSSLKGYIPEDWDPNALASKRYWAHKEKLPEKTLSKVSGCYAILRLSGLGGMKVKKNEKPTGVKRRPLRANTSRERLMRRKKEEKNYSLSKIGRSRKRKLCHPLLPRRSGFLAPRHSLLKL